MSFIAERDVDLCRCALQYGMGSSGGSKSSFTPFVDPRVYGTSPTEDDDDDEDNISASGRFLPPPLRRSFDRYSSQRHSCSDILNISNI